MISLDYKPIHGQRVRFVGGPPAPFPMGLTGTIVLAEGGYATRYIVSVMWDPDAAGVNYGRQSVLKELLELIPAGAVLTEVTPTPTAPLIQE